MALPYGFVRATVAGTPELKPTARDHETQYHMHVALRFADTRWDVAINVGTDQEDDLLKYKLVFDFRHPLVQTLEAANEGPADLTGTTALPALDFLRSDILANAGPWRDSDAMDGSEQAEPYASLKRLLVRAQDQDLPVFVFGRFYVEGDGIHDTHMNQGSTGRFLHGARHHTKDCNDVWQDGALFVRLGDGRWAAYFAAFTKQLTPTDDLGDPTPDARPIG